jgi:UDP-glucose 4-epimerase
MRLLVTGGAGYIGSVVTALLVAAGHEVTVLDDLSTGHAAAVPAGAIFVAGRVQDDAAAVLAGGVDAVLHFAARSLVGESMANPTLYWGNNLGGTLALLDAMRVAGTRRIVFSSTAAVYGEPERVPIEETDPTRPTSPYGASKVAVDTALAEFAGLHDFAPVSLRYFNVAGAHPRSAAGDGGAGGVSGAGGWLGEQHNPETHLIPNVLSVAAAIAAGRGGEVALFGDDYPTPDGTCVRDYIHVTDLAHAHLAALDACQPGRPKVYNLGSESGSSNLEVLDMCRAVTGLGIPARVEPRRPGDPAVLVASSARIRADLGWHPDRDLRAMVADAWAFTQSLALPSR